jgi:hypothetical protein
MRIRIQLITLMQIRIHNTACMYGFIFDYLGGTVNCSYDLCAYQLMEAEEWSVFGFGCTGVLLCMCENAQQNGWVKTVGDGIFKLFGA